MLARSGGLEDAPAGVDERVRYRRAVGGVDHHPAAVAIGQAPRQRYRDRRGPAADGDDGAVVAERIGVPRCGRNHFQGWHVAQSSSKDWEFERS
ncbi:hypothetical protein NUM_42290 [Actinocatenispora comari]|uniref:Uncharacterized protein n=1 Tax=Actinocatenispora comari TaxID=2807577 RepID=A0A8J4EM92_9ACTN|nr:hypothetical protein NUM_42290 [Actinocatenispora comari]